MPLDLSKLITAEAKLAEAKARKAAEINAARETAIAGGFVFNGHRFDADPTSQTNIIGTATAVANGLQLPEGFTWRTQDNQNIPVTAQDLIALGAALMAFVSGVYATSWQLKAQIDAAADQAALDAVSWPQ